jgi:hypothetical protein
MTVTIPTGSLMESALSGQACLDGLTEHDVLTSAASALLDAVAAAGDVAVRPVGRGGALIVGAASMLSRGSLRHAPQGTPADGWSKILIVEAVAVGHGGVERAVSQARQLGADWVGAWVWRGSASLNCDGMAADHVVVEGQLN